MALRIAFDLDGTVADMAVVLRQQAEALFGAELAAAAARPVPSSAASTEDPPGGIRAALAAVESMRLTPRQQQRLWQHVSDIENFWLTLPEMAPGIIARIARAAEDRSWELIFLTTRPPTKGATTQLQSQRWLADRGLRFPSVYVVERSRGLIAEALQLDAVVDDRYENCLDVALESKARPILIWPERSNAAPAAATKFGVHPVPSIVAALAILERHDDERKQPAIVRSINRILGRQSPLADGTPRPRPAPGDDPRGDRRSAPGDIRDDDGA